MLDIGNGIILTSRLQNHKAIIINATLTFDGFLGKWELWQHEKDVIHGNRFFASGDSEVEVKACFIKQLKKHGLKGILRVSRLDSDTNGVYESG